MPLIQSNSKTARRKNIASLIKEGHTPEEAVAIAYSIKPKKKRRK